MQKKVKDLFIRSGNFKEKIDVESFTKEPQMAQLLNMLIYNYPGTYQRAITTAETMAHFLEREYSLREKYEEDIPDIIRACLLLDIGYIKLPSEIINRPDNISIVEYELIKTHPKISVEIAKENGFSQLVQDIIIKHHERYDYSGYPAQIRLESNDIASYVAIADVFSALTNFKAHRRIKQYSIFQAANFLEGVVDYYFDCKTTNDFIMNLIPQYVT